MSGEVASLDATVGDGECPAEKNEPAQQGPETNEPETNEPETNERAQQEPELNELETNEPELNEPETNEPEANEPETNEPETNEPETSMRAELRPTIEASDNEREVERVVLVALGRLGFSRGRSARALAELRGDRERWSAESLLRAVLTRLTEPIIAARS